MKTGLEMVRSQRKKKHNHGEALFSPAAQQHLYPQEEEHPSCQLLLLISFFLPHKEMPLTTTMVSVS